ncbi:hypothetical protein EYF80_057237 [Liparis tanakae]|uniref:Uncharacterized protein n=1 Tax=Liparis tanakae TaxID=230148 RepID=A0A4Z2EWI7_9TELE|nr:hypothetical protein EYF80_057237 [Liparis tanakae]
MNLKNHEEEKPDPPVQNQNQCHIHVLEEKGTSQPDRARLNQTRPSQTRLNQTRPSQTRLNQTRPD